MCRSVGKELGQHIQALVSSTVPNKQGVALNIQEAEAIGPEDQGHPWLCGAFKASFVEPFEEVWWSWRNYITDEGFNVSKAPSPSQSTLYYICSSSYELSASTPAPMSAACCHISLPCRLRSLWNHKPIKLFLLQLPWSLCFFILIEK